MTLKYLTRTQQEKLTPSLFDYLQTVAQTQ